MSYAPYAPPQTPSYAEGNFSRLGGLTIAVSIGVFTSTGLGLLVFGLKTLLVARPDTPVAAEVVQKSGLVVGLVSLAAEIVFLVWMHRAAKNVRAFGQQGLEFTPGWCVGWWFIPIASLFKPYQAMREIWRASDPEGVRAGYEGAWLTRPVPNLLPLWWFTYIGSGFIAMGSVIPTFFAVMAHKPPPHNTFFGALTQVSIVVAAISVVTIVRTIDRRQSESFQKLAAPAR